MTRQKGQREKDEIKNKSKKKNEKIYGIQYCYCCCQ